jgi:hypothetical protein
MEGSRALSWRKSSRSGNNGGQCIEVAAPGLILVRDTKERAGAVLAFGPQTWRDFTARIKRNARLVLAPGSGPPQGVAAGALTSISGA